MSTNLCSVERCLYERLAKKAEFTLFVGVVQKLGLMMEMLLRGVETHRLWHPETLDCLSQSYKKAA